MNRNAVRGTRKFLRTNNTQNESMLCTGERLERDLTTFTSPQRRLPL